MGDPEIGENDYLIESHEVSAVMRRQAAQIAICNLPSAMCIREWSRVRIRHASIRAAGKCRISEKLHGSLWRDLTWIAWQTEDADKAVLRRGARGPSALYLSPEPLSGLLEPHVVTLKKCHEQIDVERRSHGVVALGVVRAVFA